MAEGDLDIKFYGDAAHVIKEQAKLIKQQEQAFEAYKKLGAESKKAGKDAEKAAKEVEKAQAASNRELERFARATKEINRTPLEKYADTMRQLNTALKAGKIDQETFNRATAGAKTELESAGKARETAFGSMAMAKLVDFAAGMGALTIATQTFTGAMERAQAVTRETMANVEALTDSRRQLNQVGESSADIEQLNKRADELAMKYGTPRDATRDMMFQARSVGFEGSADTIAKLSGANVLDMAAASRAAGKVPQLFRGAISSEASLNAVLTAAKASDLNFEGIANALPTATEGALPAGSSPAETIALLSVMAGRYKSGDIAAERMKSFGGFVAANDELKGKGIVAAVEKLRGMPAEQRKEFFGENKDVLLGYDALAGELPTFAKRLPLVQRSIDEAGTPQSFLETRAREALDPATHEGRLNAARNQYNREHTSLDVQRESQLAEGGFSRASAVLRGTRRMESEPGSGMFQNYFGEKAMQWAESVHAPNRVIEMARNAGKLVPIGMAEHLISRMFQAPERRPEGQEVLQFPGVLNGAFSSSANAPSSKADDKHLDAADQLNAAAQNMRQVSEMMLQATPDYTNIARQRAAAARFGE